MGSIWDRDTPELFSFYSNPPTNCWRGTNWKKPSRKQKSRSFRAESSKVHPADPSVSLPVRPSENIARRCRGNELILICYTKPKKFEIQTAKYFYLFLLESEEKFCTNCKKLCGFCTRHQLLHFCRATQRRSGRQFINWCVELGGNIVRLLFISVFMSAFITVVWSSVD